MTDVTHRRLRKLWEWGLINRFAFPGIRTHSEFHYYLDNHRALELLVEHERLTDIHPTMLEEVRGNREKNYAEAALRGVDRARAHGASIGAPGRRPWQRGRHGP